MKHLLAGLLALPALAVAGASADYAMQWPLQLERDDAGAYRVQLDASVYQHVQSADLGDLAVLNADGEVLPVTLLDAPARQAERAPVPVPVFALPVSADGTSSWHLVARADADGHLREVEVQGEGGSPAPEVGGAWLLDLSDIDLPVVALQLDWAATTALDLGYTVEASADLEHWRTLSTRGRLIDLQRDGQRLLHNRIVLPGGTDARYLRLTPEQRDPPIALTGVVAMLEAGTATAPQWRVLQPLDSRPGQRSYAYQLDGRFPVTQVDVALPGNHVVQWRLMSRDSAEATWRPRAGPWMDYRIERDGEVTRSAARVLDHAVRDRHWRLRAESGRSSATPPTLRLGYRPETVVFLAQGPAPYRLVAGSARASHDDSALAKLLDALRDQRGPGWQPARAELGGPQPLAGAAALTPPRDWKTWLLWGVLGLGALLVAWLALAALRKPHKPG